MIKHQPASVCWLLAGFTLFTGILSKDNIIDIQLHDTYFVFTNFYVGLLFALMLGVEGIGYYMIRQNNRRLVSGLNWIHLILTFLCILFLFSVSINPKSVSSNQYDFERWQILGMASIIAFLLLTFAQLVYLLNLTIGLFRRLYN